MEASSRWLSAYGMSGFDCEKARQVQRTPEQFDVLMMIADGKRDSPEKLSTQLQEREYPSTRKLLKGIIMEGTFDIHDWTNKPLPIIDIE